MTIITTHDPRSDWHKSIVRRGLVGAELAQTRTRDILAVAWIADGQVVRPVMTDACSFCGKVFDLTDRESYWISRINGDSRYGWEPYCPDVACQEGK